MAENIYKMSIFFCFQNFMINRENLLKLGRKHIKSEGLECLLMWWHFSSRHKGWAAWSRNRKSEERTTRAQIACGAVVIIILASECLVFSNLWFNGSGRLGRERNLSDRKLLVHPNETPALQASAQKICPTQVKTLVNLAYLGVCRVWSTVDKRK